MPRVLRWLSTKLNCSSETAVLLAATAGGDAQLVRSIIKKTPELGLYNAEGVQGPGRSSITVAAERGDLEVLKIVYEGAVKARGEAYAKQALNQGALRGQSPLMRACTFGTPQHVECVQYLLEQGADPCAETETGDNCLHMAAKNGYSECLHAILEATVTIGSGEPARLADTVIPYHVPVKFVDIRNNAGLTALHMAALKQCPDSMQQLLAAGASSGMGTVEGSNLLTKGSTALHIAAARGSQPCCSVLLDHDSTVPGLRLRSLRNENGMKASHVARMAGHEALAEIISSTAHTRNSQGQSHRHHRAHRRRRGHRHREALQTQAGGMPRQMGNPVVVLQLLKERACLLLSLREIGLELNSPSLAEGGPPIASLSPEDEEERKPLEGPQDEISTAIAAFTELWQGGELETSDSVSQGMLGSFLDIDAHTENLADEMLGKEGDPYAASALTMACLNALAFFSPAGKALAVSPTEMTRTHPLVAEVLLRVALRKLAGKAAGQGSGIATAPNPPWSPLSSSSRPMERGSRSREHRAAGLIQTVPATLEQGTSQSQPVESHENGSQEAAPASALAAAEAGDSRGTDAEQPGAADSQVSKVLAKAKRRQRRNELRHLELASQGSTGSQGLGQEAANAAPPEAAGGPDLEQQAAPSQPFSGQAHADSQTPKNGNRCVIRQAVLRTNPTGGDHPSKRGPGGSGSGSSRGQTEEEAAAQPALEPRLAPLSMASSSFESFAGTEPPLTPWDNPSNADMHGRVDTQTHTPFAFSANMPTSRRSQTPTPPATPSCTSTPPRTPPPTPSGTPRSTGSRSMGAVGKPPVARATSEQLLTRSRMDPAGERHLSASARSTSADLGVETQQSAAESLGSRSSAGGRRHSTREGVSRAPSSVLLRTCSGGEGTPSQSTAATPTSLLDPCQSARLLLPSDASETEKEEEPDEEEGDDSEKEHDVAEAVHPEGGEDDEANAKELQNGETLGGKEGEATPSIPIRHGKTREGKSSHKKMRRKKSLANFDSACPICMDQVLQVGIWKCAHKVCFGCAYQLCSRGLSSPICPFCRGRIADFASIPTIKEFQRIDQELQASPQPGEMDR